MDVVLRGRHAFIVAEHHRRRVVAYEQAQWMAFAFHDPKHMPKLQTMAEAAADTAQAAVDDAKVRGWFIAMSMREH
jgi:hypothetical protein